MCCSLWGGENLKWSGKNDLILGPLRVKQMYQGNGFATKLVHSILFNLEIKYENAYEYISNSNIASIRVAKKMGLKK